MIKKRDSTKNIVEVIKNFKRDKSALGVGVLKVIMVIVITLVIGGLVLFGVIRMIGKAS
tara:strand:- start:855 stop:1031 length:177 start_codon:yes stop_codon:yes gene_type:complete